MVDTRSSVLEPSASPICPSSPAVSPAPNAMKTAMPFAVEASTTDPASDSAATTATASASSIAGTTTRSGHQPLNAHVSTTVAKKMTTT